MCCASLLFFTFFTLTSCQSCTLCTMTAKIGLTGPMTAEGVSVMGTGMLPCSALVHYSIISQWSPHKSELCATRGEVPYGTSDPERQCVAKDPQSPTSQLLQGPPSPSLIDFNNRLRGGRMLSFIGLMGLFPGPSANTAALRAVCLDCLSCVWLSGPARLLSETHTQCPSRSVTRSLKHLFIYQLNNFFTQSLA